MSSTLPSSSVRPSEPSSLGNAWGSPADRLAALDEPGRFLLPLLDAPVVTAERTPDLYASIVRELDAVRAWYATRTGWRIVRTPAYIRLLKESVVSLPAHGWRGCMDALDYELAVWTMWYAEGQAGSKFALSGLARSVQQHCVDAIGIPRVDWTVRDHRRSLRRALEALQRLGVVDVLDGDLEAYVERGGVEIMLSTEALLAKGAAFRALLVSVPDVLVAALTQCGDMTALECTRLPEFADAKQRLYRTLLLSPAALRVDDPEAFALLDDTFAREAIEVDLWTSIGWRLEVTADYATLLRPLNDVVPGLTYPGGSGIAHLALVAVTAVRDALDRAEIVADAAGRVAIARDHFATLLTDIQRDSENRFGKTTSTLRQDELLAQTVAYLTSNGMAEVERGTQRVVLSPVYGRLAGYYAPDGLGMAQDPRLQQLDTTDSTAARSAASLEDYA